MNTSISCLRPAGVIDAEKGHHLLSEVRCRINALEQSQAKISSIRSQFHIDFSEVDFVDEQGLNYLTQLLDAVSDAQGQLLLLSVNEPVRYLFALKGLEAFELFPKRRLPCLQA